MSGGQFSVQSVAIDSSFWGERFIQSLQ